MNIKFSNIIQMRALYNTWKKLINFSERLVKHKYNNHELLIIFIQRIF